MAKHTVVVTDEIFAQITAGEKTNIRYQFTRDVKEKDKLAIWKKGESKELYRSCVAYATVKSITRHKHKVWYIRDYSLIINVQLSMF